MENSERERDRERDRERERERQTDRQTERVKERGGEVKTRYQKQSKIIRVGLCYSENYTMIYNYMYEIVDMGIYMQKLTKSLTCFSLKPSKKSHKSSTGRIKIKSVSM